ncbi:hypothetical protein [Adhaeribacter radiodurans]|uniref:Uncharacterized protein n=1 Tax=Adhaeribacter radiodurans TaxID=2745197 RepID=A0A7L7L7L7_9BACT|nr:hypothetical protein [Adhaeribacter radiodurans]QMU28832.1 hypothetical protein HUW48_12640 [Adhaeribacter radiodurans]
MQQNEITEKLHKKGWLFMINNAPTADFMGKAVWAYNPVEVGNMEKGAEAWCVLYYLPKSSSRILYNYFNLKALTRIHKKIKRYKMSRIETGNELKGVSSLSSYTDYANNTFVFSLMTYDTPIRFGIKIFDKEDFMKAKENNQL